MAIKIVHPDSVTRGSVAFCECEILADAESDITGLGEVVNDGRIAVHPAPGSLAYTADLSVVYQLSPSNVWTRVVM